MNLNDFPFDDSFINDIGDEWNASEQNLWLAWEINPDNEYAYHWVLAELGDGEKIKASFSPIPVEIYPFSALKQLFISLQRFASEEQYIHNCANPNTSERYLAMYQEGDCLSEKYSFSPLLFADHLIQANKMVEYDEKLICVFPVEGVWKMIEESERIISQQDYSSIFYDFRPTTDSHPIDWLLFKKDWDAAKESRKICHALSLYY